MATPLEANAIREALKELPGWRHQNDRLEKEFTFSGFKEALSFLVRVGLHAEEQRHHPEIVNVFNRVNLRLTTHDANDEVTEKDVKLARTIESFNWTD